MANVFKTMGTSITAGHRVPVAESDDWIFLFSSVILFRSWPSSFKNAMERTPQEH